MCLEVVDIGLGDGEEDLCDDAAAATDEVCSTGCGPAAWLHVTMPIFYLPWPIAVEMRVKQLAARSKIVASSALLAFGLPSFNVPSLPAYVYARICDSTTSLVCWKAL